MRKSREGNIIPISRTDPGLYDIQKEMAENTIGKKIALARQDKKLSLARCSELLKAYGVSLTPAAINKWEFGSTVPNAYQLMAVAEALEVPGGIAYFAPDAPPPRLNREGRRKVKEYERDLIDSGNYPPDENEDGNETDTAARTETALPAEAPAEKPPIRFREMRVSELSVSAGPGNYAPESSFRTVSFPEDLVPAGADFGIIIRGDSMEPEYPDGRVAWVQECDVPELDRVGIFVYDGSGYIKRYSEQEPAPECRDAYVTSDGRTRPQSVLISLNPAYAPIVIRPDAEFRTIGRVIGCSELP